MSNKESRASVEAEMQQAWTQDSGGSSAQVTALLLDVLRSANREVQAATVLGGPAADAVAHFQAIAASLRTLADGPAASLGARSDGAGAGAITAR